MKEIYFTLLLNLPLLLFEQMDWDEEEYDAIDDVIYEIEENIIKELEENLIGKTKLLKDDIVRKYFNDIAENNDNILSAIYDEDDYEIFPGLLALKKVKELYQFVVDLICEISIKNNIDLIEMVNNNHHLYCRINISNYYNLVESSMLKVESSKSNFNNVESNISIVESNLKKCFVNDDAYKLFTYLNDNFGKFREFNKFSCIYRFMYKDKLIDNEIRPQVFKRYIERFYNIEFKLVFYLEIDLSTKIKDHYKSLLDTYYS